MVTGRNWKPKSSSSNAPQHAWFYIALLARSQIFNVSRTLSCSLWSDLLQTAHASHITTSDISKLRTDITHIWKFLKALRGPVRDKFQ